MLSKKEADENLSKNSKTVRQRLVDFISGRQEPLIGAYIDLARGLSLRKYYDPPLQIEIKGVSSYHSIKYLDEGMRLYRYFNIGAGILVKYESSKLPLTYSVEKEFSHTQTKNVRDQQEAERLKLKEKGIDS